MATAAILQHLIDIILSALKNEASLLGGIYDKFYNLRRELESMKSFLEDAERKQLKSEGEKTWVANVRDIAYQVEDIIDEFMYFVHQQHSRGGFSQLFHQTVRIPKVFWLRHRIASKLQNINNIIKVIPEWRDRYGVNNVEGGSSSNYLDHKWSLYRRDSPFFIKEDDLIGKEEETQVLKGWLMDRDLQQILISVVGMGGSGKTTLVGKIYNNETVKRRFDCYAWITVSQSNTREELFRSLINEFCQGRKEHQLSSLSKSNSSFKNLVVILTEYLKDKKYLVVLDDVWDINLWDAINVALPDNKLGSRILLTTRNKDVGSFSSGVRSHILSIQPLKKSEAWDLFCQKAFLGESCPSELASLATELVKKCEGLPLALVALGGLMSSKKSISDWRSVCNNLNWQLNNNHMLEFVKSILLLSFNDLPYPLKHCFLYCCLFPEDYLIRRKRLIRLWIAEGFVQQVNRITPEEVAENYLMELIARSMLQVVLQNQSGRPKACKMHDILRELALSISEREKFCIVYNGRIAIEECKARRLSVQTTNEDLESYHGMSQIRSLFMFLMHLSSFPNTLVSKLKLLRVLDLEDATIEKLPDGINILFNLRYLNLKGTRVTELPKNIGKLRNLETLNIKETLIRELPKGVAELQNLRNLIMYRYNHGNSHQFQYASGTRVPFKINKLKKLQVMSFIEAEGDVIRQLGSMTQLTRMGISNLRAGDEEDLCSSILNLKKLRYLFLMAHNEAEFLQMDALLSSPPHLDKLILVGRLKRVPHWFCSLKYLTYLYLHWSRLNEDLLPHIAALPHLGNLDLDNAFIGEELHFSKGFTKLRSLWLTNFPQLRAITIEKGAMPDIQLLSLASCAALDLLPQD
ncbi:disease resistance protein RPM1 isoform X2 [Jatropha curcas]|uniref:disease resistance protein RPM1 isoform X2 n=1 Tax=Jatropha curcas TaxID=180498 RepID=UPI0009D6EEBA|nr:disease resistance protein RPM1 isoform X2 [Jatropha curcas]